MADSTTSVINASSARQSVLEFFNSNVYVELGSEIDLANQSFTIELWDRRLSWGQFSLLGQASNLHMGYNAQQHFFFQTHGSTLTAPKAYDNDLSWHHWAVTFDADTKAQAVYLNGFLLIEDIASQAYTGTGEWVLGPDTQTKNRNTYGQMADVRIWDYVRSQEEIQADRFRRLNGDEGGLLGYWPLNEGQGFTAYDRTRYSHHGKISHATGWRQQLALQSSSPVTQLQAALRLNAYPTSRASIYPMPGFSTGTFAHTIEAWFYCTGFSSNYSWLLCAGQTGNWNSHYWVLNKPASTLEIGSRTSARDTLDIPVQLGKWHHIASVFDGKKLSVYVDGVLFPRPIVSSLSLPNYYFYLGQNYTSRSGTHEDGRGIFSELRLWKYARSEEEIQADMYHRLVGDEKDLAVYWPIDEGYKNTLHDKTSNAKHTTISGSYVWEEQLFLIPAHHDSLKSAQEQANADRRQRVTGGSGTTTTTTTTTTGTSTRAVTAKVKAKVVRPSVLSFDGTDDYIDCGDGIQPTEAITVEAWVKHEEGSGYIVNGGGSETDDGHSLSWQDGNIRVELQNTQSKKKVNCENAAPSDNEWHHIAFTWSRQQKTVRTYIDGELAQTTEQFAGTLGISQQATNIGRNSLHDGYFHGQITEVRIWERVRSQDEIEQTMKYQLVGNEAGLIGYWPLDDKGTTVKDRSGGDRHGTVIGATWEEAEIPLEGHRLWETGLEDYGYWYRWAQSLPESTSGKPFRRGRIWG